MLEGAFILTMIFGSASPGHYRQFYGPIEFMTFADCQHAGNVLSHWLAREPGEQFQIFCTSKKTGEVLLKLVWPIPTPANQPKAIEP